MYVINNKSNKTNITLWDKWILLEVCVIDNKSNCGCLIVKEEKKNGRPYLHSLTYRLIQIMQKPPPIRFKIDTPVQAILEIWEKRKVSSKTKQNARQGHIFETKLIKSVLLTTINSLSIGNTTSNVSYYISILQLYM